MSHDNPLKWKLPGWRIEQKYANGVLIGNWSEERYQFQKGNYKHNSTHLTDFKNYGNFRPDVILRRKAMLKNDDGQGAEMLFCHHGNRYSNNMISWYDEQFNKRSREDTDRLPELRHWDSHQLAWVPERSDYPMKGAPTNFNLKQGLSDKWQSQIADETRGDYITTYRGSYVGEGTDAGNRARYATPKQFSTSLLTANKINKDINLRNSAALRSPEQLPSLATTTPMTVA